MSEKYTFSIIIIDDAYFVRNLLSRAIGLKPKNDKYDFEILSHSNDGEEGLNLYKITKPDIVLLDLNMPKMNGLELIEKIKEINKDQEIIICTSNLDEKIKNDIEKQGIYYLQKPFQNAYLWKRLDTIANTLIHKRNNNLNENTNFDIDLKKLENELTNLKTKSDNKKNVTIKDNEKNVDVIKEEKKINITVEKKEINSNIDKNSKNKKNLYIPKNYIKNKSIKKEKNISSLKENIKDNSSSNTNNENILVKKEVPTILEENKTDIIKVNDKNNDILNNKENVSSDYEESILKENKSVENVNTLNNKKEDLINIENNISEKESTEEKTNKEKDFTKEEKNKEEFISNEVLEIDTNDKNACGKKINNANNSPIIDNKLQNIKANNREKLNLSKNEEKNDTNNTNLSFNNVNTSNINEKEEELNTFSKIDDLKKDNDNTDNLDSTDNTEYYTKKELIKNIKYHLILTEDLIPNNDTNVNTNTNGMNLDNKDNYLDDNLNLEDLSLDDYLNMIQEPNVNLNDIRDSALKMELKHTNDEYSKSNMKGKIKITPPKSNRLSEIYSSKLPNEYSMKVIPKEQVKTKKEKKGIFSFFSNIFKKK